MSSTSGGSLGTDTSSPTTNATYTWILTPLAVFLALGLLVTCVQFHRRRRAGRLGYPWPTGPPHGPPGAAGDGHDIERSAWNGPGYRIARMPGGALVRLPANQRDGDNNRASGRRGWGTLGGNGGRAEWPRTRADEGLNELGEAPPAYEPKPKKSTDSAVSDDDDDNNGRNGDTRPSPPPPQGRDASGALSPPPPAYWAARTPSSPGGNLISAPPPALARDRSNRYL